LGGLFYDRMARIPLAFSRLAACTCGRVYPSGNVNNYLGLRPRPRGTASRKLCGERRRKGEPFRTSTGEAPHDTTPVLRYCYPLRGLMPPPFICGRDVCAPSLQKNRPQKISTGDDLSVCDDYQITHAFARTIGWPCLQPKASANCCILDIGPFTRQRGSA